MIHLFIHLFISKQTFIRYHLLFLVSGRSTVSCTSSGMGRKENQISIRRLGSKWRSFYFLSQKQWSWIRVISEEKGLNTYQRDKVESAGGRTFQLELPAAVPTILWLIKHVRQGVVGSYELRHEVQVHQALHLVPGHIMPSVEPNTVCRKITHLDRQWKESGQGLGKQPGSLQSSSYGKRDCQTGVLQQRSPVGILSSCHAQNSPQNGLIAMHKDTSKSWWKNRIKRWV